MARATGLQIRLRTSTRLLGDVRRLDWGIYSKEKPKCHIRCTTRL